MLLTATLEMNAEYIRVPKSHRKEFLCPFYFCYVYGSIHKGQESSSVHTKSPFLCNSIVQFL